MLFKLSNLNSNLALTLGYLKRALNNSAQTIKIVGSCSWCSQIEQIRITVSTKCRMQTTADHCFQHANEDVTTIVSLFSNPENNRLQSAFCTVKLE